MLTGKKNSGEVKSSFRDRVATVDAAGKRVWIYPQLPKGRMYCRRNWLMVLYVAVLIGLPFIKVEGHPLFLLHIPERRFILFGQIFWPQDFFIFAIGMLLFIVFIALFTVVFGRVFCGWVCPQTIFMELIFRRIEVWIEGNAMQQQLLNKAPWGFQKIRKKAMKWIIFWVMSFIIAHIFLAYIIGVDALEQILRDPPGAHPGGLAAILIFSTVFFFVYVWMREQVCTVVCPYGRLQGVLLDKQSILVAYDYKRGEPRGKFKKNEARSAGDCIDCHQCVKVCPTGIDIRNGTQLECVNCTACIDACDHMMQAAGLPRGLIRYASESNIAEGRKPRFTARMKAYTVVMLLLLCTEVLLLATRTDVSTSILRTPGQLYQEQPGGRISNLYNYKLLNKTYAGKQITLRPQNFKGSIELVGEHTIRVPQGSYASGTLFIYREKADVHLRKTDLLVGVYEGDKKIQTVKVTFLGPFTAD